MDEILEMWNKDVSYDETELGRESLKNSLLHGKYIKIFHDYKMKEKSLFFELERMRKLRREYYTGRLSEEQLEENGWEPFQFILKTEIKDYLDGDDYIIAIAKKFTYYVEASKVLESIIKQIGSRAYEISKAIDYQRFIQGG
jgi:hypothetical protein